MQAYRWCFSLFLAILFGVPGYCAVGALEVSTFVGGVDDSFVDERLARKVGLPLVELTNPKTVLDLE